MVTTRRVGLKIKSGQRYILSTSVVKANCSEWQLATPYNNLFFFYYIREEAAKHCTCMCHSSVNYANSRKNMVKFKLIPAYTCILIFNFVVGITKCDGGKSVCWDGHRGRLWCPDCKAGHPVA